MKNERTAKDIKAEALRLGFAVCGITRAEAVDDETARQFRQWLAEGNHAGMHYMENHLEKRLDPRLLLEGAKTIVCVALNYSPARRLPEGEYQLADYALGQDYHDVMRQKLHQLAAAILTASTSQAHTDISLQKERTQEDAPSDKTPPYRAFADSAPILERYWAVKAGLGWIGRNHQLIIPSTTMGGSRFFLGELILCEEMDEYDTPMPNRCGNCHQCIDACPTGALTTHSMFAAEKCLSYQTIENRGNLSPQAKKSMGDTIYGCDRCQQVCPWNRFSRPTVEPLLQPRDELLKMTKEKWLQLTPEEYRVLFKGSAVKRAKYEGLMRNIRAVSQNED